MDNMQTGEFRIGSIQTLASSKLKSALAFVSEGWLPLNTEIVKDIKAKCVIGYYSKDRGLLVKDLQRDLSLFLLCVRKLRELLETRGDAPVDDLNPATLLESAELSDIRNMLEKSGELASPHRLTHTNTDQAKVLASMVTSATAAGVLCDKYQIDSATAYFAAVFRQIGYALIAWNYPHVYARAIKQSKSGKSLTSILNRTLGFSPSTLSLALARKWNLCSTLRIALGESALPVEISAREQARAERLEALCRAGEALARAAAPEVLGEPNGDWRQAMQEIEDTVGGIAFSKLLQKNLGDYLKNNQEGVTVTDAYKTFDAASKLQQTSQGTRIYTNRYINDCGSSLRAALSKCYAMIREDAICRDAISTLANEALQASGFEGGCVYLFDPSSQELVPRFALGVDKPRNFSSFYAFGVLYTDSTLSSIIKRAFQNPAPQLVSKLDGRGRLVHMLSGLLGEVSHSGVLMLRTAREDFDEATAMIAFKAFRSTLADALHLS